MPKLLITLGTSPAVVPEAFLLPGVTFGAVHVLTTASVDPVDVAFVLDWFSDRAPMVQVTVTRVDGFSDLRTEEDHFHFEEVLYRWMLEKGGGEPSYVCLSGGFKTMSATMQKAAAVLGAAEVFHVLCDAPPGGQPSTGDAIESARIDGRLHWIRLGRESGWPQFRGEVATRYPLMTVREEGAVRWVAAGDQAFRWRIREVVERSHNLAGAWDRLAGLPFPVLATWPAEVLAWLEEPVDPVADRDWVASLPKMELHCHLGGFATHGSALRDVRAAATFPDRLPRLVEPIRPADWPEPSAPIGLETYMALGDANGRALLRDPGCLRRQCELLYDHLREQNVVHAEIRCSPNNYTSPGRSAWQVLCDIRAAFQAKMDEAAVAASVALGSTVKARVPRGDRSGASGSIASADITSPRVFIPFDREADYRQTWRDLPHRHQPGAAVFATFRLADSLPRAALERWAEERDQFLETHPKPWDDTTWTRYRREFPERLEAWLDEAQGECLLRDARIAGIVEAALRHFDGSRYILDAFVIMPNHVHVIFKPMTGHGMSAILHSWKSFTAKEINRVLERRGQVWEHESFDHLLRSAAQLKRVRNYVRGNPEMAGLKDGCVVGMGLGLEVAGAENLGGEGNPEHGELPMADASSGTSDSNDATAEASRRLAGTVESSRRLAPTVHLIVIATRKDGGDRSDISRHLALAITAADQWKDGCRVVGVDLAGWERPETRAALFATDFEPVHRVGLAVTVHAGENDDAEGIWQAVFKLNARRLGHALHLVEAPDLLREVAARGIGIEMCPFANVQIKGFAMDAADGATSRFPAYPLKTYLDAGVRVTVNTDNIGISDASLTDNLLLAARLCPALTRMDMVRLLAHALQVAFVSPADRERMVRCIEAHLTGLAAAATGGAASASRA
jgi:adenosine deaminase